MKIRRTKPKRDWSSAGVRSKPAPCQLCPRAVLGAGFVEDRPGLQPRLAVVKALPTKDEIVDGRAFSGAAAWRWSKEVFEPLGLGLGDVLWSNLVRCWSTKFPQGSERDKALGCCRTHDRVLDTWRPTVALITQDFESVITTPAFLTLLQNDLGRAVRLSLQGERPVVLMGNDVMHHYAPWLKPGGAKRWRGHWWRLEEKENTE